MGIHSSSIISHLQGYQGGMGRGGSAKDPSAAGERGEGPRIPGDSRETDEFKPQQAKIKGNHVNVKTKTANLGRSWPPARFRRATTHVIIFNFTRRQVHASHIATCVARLKVLHILLVGEIQTTTGHGSMPPFCAAFCDVCDWVHSWPRRSASHLCRGARCCRQWARISASAEGWNRIWL